MTSGLNFRFRNDVFSATILSTSLFAFVYVDFMLLTLFRSKSFSKP